MATGFAEQWLGWHDRQISGRETTFRQKQIVLTVLGFIVAAVVAVVVALLKR
jgi:hypothetical protein